MADPMASPPVVPPAAGRAWATVAILFLLSAVSMADRHVISILAGAIKADFGLGDFQLSLLLGFAFASFYTIFAYPFGWAADRWPQRNVIFWAVVLWSVASAGSGLAIGFASLFAMRALVGVGEAGLGPSAHSLLAASFPRERLSLPIAIQAFGIPFGAGLGVATAGFILSRAPDWDMSAVPLLAGMKPWQLAFVALGMPGLGLAFLALFLPAPSSRRGGREDGQSIWPYLRRNWRQFACLTGGMGLASMAIQNLSTWSPEYLRRSFEVEPFTIGAKMGGVAMLAAIVGQIGSGFVVDRMTRGGMRDAPVRHCRRLLCVLVPVALAAFLMPDENLYFLALLAMMILLMPALSLGPAAIQMMAPPPLRARLSASYGMGINLIAFAIGPTLVGGLSQYIFGERHLGMALAAATLGCAVLAILLLGMALRHSSASSA